MFWVFSHLYSQFMLSMQQHSVDALDCLLAFSNCDKLLNILKSLCLCVFKTGKLISDNLFTKVLLHFVRDCSQVYLNDLYYTIRRGIQNTLGLGYNEPQ